MTNIIPFAVGLFAIASTYLGGLFAIKLKDKLHLILGFSAGAVIAVALFDLIPEAFELASVKTIGYIPLLIGIGFAMYMIIDRFFSLHAHNEEHCENPCHKGRLGAITLSLHSFLDGLGVGLAFKVSSVLGWTMAIAVLTHDFSDGINTANMILKNGGSRKDALKWLAADAFAPFLGILVSLFMIVDQEVLGLILALFAGFFLYLGASDLIPESHHHHPTVWTTISTILGMLVLFLVIYFS